jgi:F0F1-type ATP synthase assembly protein I
LKGESKNPYLMVSRYLGIAMLLPMSTAIGYAIGYLLDKQFGTRFMMPVFLILGIVAGFVQLIRELQKDTKSEE